MSFVEERGGLGYAARRAEEFSVMAKSMLSGFPESASKESLLAFADFVITREK
jgi:geranylgeranyl pyrophosphate synthase